MLDGYLLALLLATIESASAYSLIHWCILFAKFLFFAFLLFYLNEKFIVTTLRIYANLMVLTVLFAVVAVVVAALGYQPLATVDLHGTLTNFYFGSYYTPHYSPICAPAPIYRIQGLSEEPGTFGFVLLPAFFWLVIAEKAYVRSAIIVLGISLTMSLGTGLFLLMLLPLIAWKFSSHYKVPVFFLSVICIIGTMYVVSGPCQTSYLENLQKNQSNLKNKDEIALSSVLDECTKLHSKSECISILKYNSASTASGKVHSFKDRFGGTLIAWSYLKNHVMGTGTGLGMSSINAIAAGTSANAEGYVVAILEAGIVGGLLYLCLFAIMGWLAIKAIVFTAIYSFDDRVMVVVALSVCSVLVMGAQRIQPDITLWHLWIYAMWFYLLQKMSCSKVAG